MAGVEAGGEEGISGRVAELGSGVCRFPVQAGDAGEFTRVRGVI